MVYKPNLLSPSYQFYLTISNYTKKNNNLSNYFNKPKEETTKTEIPTAAERSTQVIKYIIICVIKYGIPIFNKKFLVYL